MVTERCCTKKMKYKDYKLLYDNLRPIPNGLGNGISNRVINIPVYFHVCVPVSGSDPNKVILEDVHYSIQMLDKDFAGRATNFAFSDGMVQETFTGYPKKYVKNMWNDALKSSRDSGFRFKYHGHQHVDISIEEFVTEYGSIEGIGFFINVFAPPVTPEKVLNIWIIPLSDSVPGFLGYATLPWDKSSGLNGVVLDYSVFGKNKPYARKEYNKNKTMTHEIGHWLGLLHTFEDFKGLADGDIALAAVGYEDGTNKQQFIGDCVIDTPPQKKPTFGNPLRNKNFDFKSILTSYNNNTYCPQFVNFMDYSDDECLFMFSRDQINKMLLFTAKYRPLIFNSKNNYDNKYK